MGRWADRAAELSAGHRTFTGAAISAVCAERAEATPPQTATVTIDPIGAASRPFASELARLAAMARPLSVRPAQWERFGRDAVVFMDHWGGTAAALGWSTLALFGCSPGFARRLDRDGLLWLLDGQVVVEVTPDTAVIANVSGGLLTCRRALQSSDAVLPWGA